MLLQLGVEQFRGTAAVRFFQQHARSLEQDTSFKVIFGFYGKHGIPEKGLFFEELHSSVLEAIEGFLHFAEPAAGHILYLDGVRFLDDFGYLSEYGLYAVEPFLCQFPFGRYELWR